MPTSVLQLLDARTLLGFALGIAATALAIWLQARVEHGRWLRQQRLEAFVDFLVRLESLARPATKWQDNWDQEEEESRQDAFDDALEAFARAGGRMQFLSGARVNAAGQRAFRRWSVEIRKALVSHNAEKLDSSIAAATDDYQRFTETARVELGEPKEYLTEADLSALAREFPQTNGA